MEFYQHLVISTLVGSVVSLGFSSGIEQAVLIVAVSATAGTLIDLDHFLIDRYKSGSWGFLKCVIVNFPRSLIEVDVCEENFFEEWYRYITHGVILISAITAGFFISSILLKTIQLSLAIHMICDFYHDNA